MSEFSPVENPGTEGKHDASRLRVLGVIALIAVTGVLAAALIQLSIDGSDAMSTTIPRSAMSAPDSDKVRPDSSAQVASAETEDQQRGTYAIEFPDGERVPFRLRAIPRLPPPPDGKVVNVYDELSAAANRGDANAAMILSNLLQECSMAHRSEQDLDRAIDTLYQTHTAILPGSETPARIAGTDDMRVVEERFRELHEQCEGVSDRQIDEADQWLQKAATLGNPRALIAVAQSMLGHRDPKAQHYLELAWRAGDLQAASHLWYFYSNGPPHQMDMVKGYAYKYIHDGILGSAVAGGETVLHGPPISADSTKNASLRLNPRQEREALALAKDLLRQNPLCCFSRRLTK